MTTAVKHEYDRVPYLVAYAEQFGRTRRLRRCRRTRGAREPPAAAKGQAIRHGSGVHASHRRRGVSTDDERARPRGTSRHLLQQPLPRHRLRSADGEGGRGSRRVHQGCEESTGLFEGSPRWLERRRLAFGVLPAAGPEPDRDGQPVRRWPRPHQARPDPCRRDHAAGRARQPARHDDRVVGRVDSRRVRPVKA